MEVGSHISVLVGSSVHHSKGSISLIISMIHGEVAGETEKAVKIAAKSPKGKEITSWFPKAALASRESGSFELAKWFKPSGWTEKFIQLAQVESGISTN